MGERRGGRFQREGEAVKRGRKWWYQPGQKKATGGLYAEKKQFSGGRRRLGVKEIGLGFLFLFFICQNCPPLLFELWTSIYR
jgi:hypothetical protein